MLCVKAAGNAIVAYPYSPTDLIRDTPATSFPSGPLSTATLAEWNVFPVTLTARPNFNPLTHRVVEEQPSFSTDRRSWLQRWSVVPLTADEINAYEAAAAEADRAVLDIVYGNNPDYTGVDYSKLLPAFVKAVRELTAEVESLKAQLAGR